MIDFLSRYPAVFAALIFVLFVIVISVEGFTRRRWLRRITQAVRQKSHIAASKNIFSGPADDDTDEFITQLNELIDENRDLKRLRTGHLAQLDATLGNLQEAVLIIDAGNTILLANKALRSIFPGSASALHQRVEQVVDSPAFLEYVTAVRNGTARPQHEIAFTKAGDRNDGVDGNDKGDARDPHDTRWVEVTGALIPPAGSAGFPPGGRREAPPKQTPPKPPGENPALPDSSGAASGAWALFVFHDITRQKKLEAVRKDFVANVSHELRTPLSLVKGCAETLVDGHRDMPLADREKFLLTIQRHSERLDTLIADLLTLSRLESSNPGLQTERVSLPQFIAAIVADHRARPAAVAHTFNLSIAGGIGEASIDPRKITQVFENLIGNALNHTPAGSRIDITAALLDAAEWKRASRPLGQEEQSHPSGRDARFHSAEIEICVRDNGPGIPAADLPHMFERFYRVDKARSRETGGTGLGLSIVKHIVQLHGGRVRVESDHGKGAAFYFTLPA